MNQWNANALESYNSMDQIKIPFLENLNFPYLTKLTNDPVLHSPSWTPLPTNLPLNISKFNGKPKEDRVNHVMTFHL